MLINVARWRLEDLFFLQICNEGRARSKNIFQERWYPRFAKYWQLTLYVNGRVYKTVTRIYAVIGVAFPVRHVPICPISDITGPPTVFRHRRRHIATLRSQAIRSLRATRVFLRASIIRSRPIADSDERIGGAELTCPNRQYCQKTSLMIRIVHAIGRSSVLLDITSHSKASWNNQLACACLCLKLLTGFHRWT